MCGIAGLFDLRAERMPDGDRLGRMLRALAHRGPDGETRHLEPGLAFGHRRLAIIDVEGGSQPIFNEDGTAAVLFNGMIYNYRTLMDDLGARGHRFRTRCDTETIVHGFEQWGADVVDHLDGFFAFAVWNRNTRQLLLARDRFGKKPLYYAVDSDGWLVFASEVGAILAALGQAPALRADAVEDYLAFGYVPEPKSVFQGIEKLPPAHRVLLKGRDGRIAPEAYWDLRFPERPDDIDEAAAMAGVRERLDAAVAKRLVADVPLGAFLSGGVDSSAIVASMARTSDHAVQTCAMGFDDPSVDETRFAQMVADRYHTDHFTEVVNMEAASLIGTLAHAYGEPFADASALPTFLVSRLARRRVTVALSGDGGDEVFAGYRRYPFHMREEALKAWVPSNIRRLVFGPLARLYPALPNAPRWLRARATFEALSLDTVGGFFRAVTIMPDAVRDAVRSRDLGRTLAGYHPSEVLRTHADRAGTDDALARAQYIDLKTWLPGQMLVKVDRASMSNGLEVRNPFLDRDLVEWAARLPAHLKVQGFSGKHVLKRAMEERLPREVLYRPKQGFTAPIDRWMRAGLDDRLAGLAASPRLRESGLVSPEGIASLVTQHRTGRGDFSRPLWALMMFDAFLEETARTVADSLTSVAPGVPKAVERNLSALG
ncbi:XrtA/PEP-CTERM system amidotransferase [Futiania mangrovi]|uniref:asparagine synthase (glutamine-hydrolyzing) n=1 Tax=Futiania mangrovi TaxID=2959716 RepID=A0A9J6PCB9_9PROT|nr:XrtA/PEP-CTERM system amidotransferase [Futiania mangrovii]MCP1335902.1 amidotransferase 1, exosortase A system-associated [Futiania mangrovii]